MRFTSSLMAMWTHAEHAVAPNQMEPGLAPEDQAHDHVLDFGMYAIRLSGEYVPTDGLAVGLILPIQAADVSAHFHDDEGEEIESFESIHHRDELMFGIGDPEVTGIWEAVTPGADQPWGLKLELGTSLPLGATEPDPFALGMAGQTHQHLFFGTGTFDPIAAFELRYAGSGWTSILWSRSRVSLYANSHGYTGAGVTQGGLGVLTSFGLESFKFLIEAGALEESPAKWGSEPAKNSGRTELMVNLGMAWFGSENWTYSAMVKRPVYTSMLGGQMDIPLVSMISATYMSGAPEEDGAQ
jgi:hypothetical protein